VEGEAFPSAKAAGDRSGERKGPEAEGETRTGTGVIGAVSEILPSALYRVRVEGGRFVTAHIANRIDRNFVRLLVGDRVRVELSPVDYGRGRIVEKL
jgi:translation initiation factor IF-1